MQQLRPCDSWRGELVCFFAVATANVTTFIYVSIITIVRKVKQWEENSVRNGKKGWATLIFQKAVIALSTPATATACCKDTVKSNLVPWGYSDDKRASPAIQTGPPVRNSWSKLPVFAVLMQWKGATWCITKCLLQKQNETQLGQTPSSLPNTRYWLQLLEISPSTSSHS